MSSSEFSEWMAFYRIEPWGSEVDDLRAGNVAAAVYNVNRDPKKTRPLEAAAFRMITNAHASAEEPEQSPGEIYAQFKTWALMHGGGAAAQ